MQKLPHALYRTAQIRELDRLASSAFGVPGSELMERAGRAAWTLLRREWPAARRIGVVCGGGNNGGDGYVVARLAHEAGFDAAIIATTPPGQLRGEAALAAERARGVAVLGPETPLESFDLLVDGLLGIGINGEVRGVARDLIARMNRSGRPVLALDTPSGLDADTGRLLGDAVQARVTISFIGLKAGCFTGAGREYAGRVVWDGLGLPDELLARVTPVAQLMESPPRGLPPRRRDAHKGAFGHVLVVGGNHGFSGAARLAAEAAARVGAGLVSVATRPVHSATMAAARPELMVHGIDSGEALAPLLARATVIAVGPGLGRDEWARALLARVLECNKPLVVDADALNLLGDEALRRERWVLTPHPGEAARLLGCSSSEIEADRFAAAASLQASYGGVVVLKGAGTLVLDGDGRMAVCAGGNPGMASGGMGDLLTGVIAGLMAQGLEPGEAARTGVSLHAAAADAAARDGERGLLAGDLLPHLRRLVNQS